MNLRLNISIVNALWVILVGEQLDLEDPTLAEILKVSGFALALQITILALNYFLNFIILSCRLVDDGS